MEKLPSVKLEKRSQKTSKKNPVKVVYISNPMKIKATPSEFRAVVQQFTGRYAISPPPGALTGVPERDHEVGSLGAQQKWQLINRASIDAQLTVAGSDPSHESACREDQVSDDLIITPQMLESFSPLFPNDFGS
ncbi:sigma factor binding protein 1, chloroplastic [Lactuca sativa]|uniref:sigma factor binding protein 1, chloroplastic n=1 Tax=Lactuca sativa TaxID=4236 RepID=UPI000CB57B7F|nr:sigma factor binding protein 1, chloroplastic [Lactuca sativa]